MNKRKLHHAWRYIRVVKPAYFLLIAALFSVIFVFAARENNQRMAELREAVYIADEQNGDVAAALGALQLHVTNHMNTSLTTGEDAVYPPIQLKSTYDRLNEVRVSQVQQSNASLYTRAQAYCQEQNSTDFSGANRVPCIEQYVQDNGADLPETIPASLYQFDFVAAKWSPDLAGWSLVATVLFVILAFVKLIVDIRIRRYVR